MSDIQTRTMEKAFYLQTKAFLEKNSEHIAEIARLKAEVERLTKAVMHSPAAQLKLKELEGKTTYEEINPIAEIARLKAEVERLTAFTTRTIIPNEELQAQVEELKDALFKHSGENYRLQIERQRLTKAGDELHIFLISYIVEGRISSSYLNELDDNWNAAKEGKGQP